MERSEVTVEILPYLNMRQVIILAFTMIRKSSKHRGCNKKNTGNQVCPEKNKVALRIEGSHVKKYI